MSFEGNDTDNTKKKLESLPHVAIYSENTHEVVTIRDEYDEVRSESDGPKKRKITIHIDQIDNIDICRIREIKVKAEFLQKTIVQSDVIHVKEKTVEILCSGFIEVIVDAQFIDDVLNNPVLFTDCTTAYVPPTIVSRPEKEGKKKKKSPPSSASSVTMAQGHHKILGISNLDIGSLTMKGYGLKETLVLEPEKKLPVEDNIPWTKLPKISVEVFTESEPLIAELGNRFNNVLGITVESVYNPPDILTEGMTFDAIIQIPNFREENNRVIFPGGTLSPLKDSSSRKKWYNLYQEEGNVSKTKYLIKPTACDIYSSLPSALNLEREINGLHSLIEWNIWKNFLLEKTDEKFLFSKLIKSREWPIEISATKQGSNNKGKPEKEKKTAKSTNSTNTPTRENFVAFLNLSSLLYPGVSKVRVAAQLHTCTSSMDIPKNVESDNLNAPQSKVSSILKNNSKNSQSQEKSTFSIKPSGETKNEFRTLVFNTYGRPTFIVVEVELYKPLVAKRDPEYLHQKLNKYLSVKGKMNKVEKNLLLARENYVSVIKDVVTALNKEYKLFCANYEKNKFENKYEFVSMDNDFEIYLSQSELFHKIKGTLERRIVELVKEKYGTMDQTAIKSPEIYAYLVEEMHRVTNKGYFEHEKLHTSSYNTSNLQLYSEEAMEEGDLELAKTYQLMKLSNDPCNPDYWLDYAVFCNQTNDMETAIESVKEALTLSSHHQLGLLMYGLLMANSNDGTIATLTFEVLLSKYPDFVEGWVMLRLLYIIFNNVEGAEVVGQTAIKIECEKRHRDTVCSTKKEPFTINKIHIEDYELAGGKKYGVSAFVNGRSLSEPLSWTSALSPPKNVHAITAVLLLKLGFFNLACAALSQAIHSDSNSTNPYYTYYQAVTQYVMGRYGEAMSTLKTLVNSFGKECSAWALMGHCYYKLKENDKAVTCYEYIIECYNRPDDIHLIYLRMGYYYIKTQKYECAKNIFLTACKYSPSPKLWKGAGIAYLRLGELEDAETAFKECNYLDNRDPDSWGYLALTNILMQKIDLFRYCYSEAKKRNINNEILLQEIETCIILNRLTDVD